MNFQTMFNPPPPPHQVCNLFQVILPKFFISSPPLVFRDCQGVQNWLWELGRRVWFQLNHQTKDPNFPIYKMEIPFVHSQHPHNINNLSTIGVLGIFVQISFLQLSVGYNALCFSDNLHRMICCGNTDVQTMLKSRPRCGCQCPQFSCRLRRPPVWNLLIFPRIWHWTVRKCRPTKTWGCHTEIKVHREIWNTTQPQPDQRDNAARPRLT